MVLKYLELEEFVGKCWHRVVGERRSYPSHPDAAVSLDEVRHMLGVFFRGLGGHPATRVAATGEAESDHRLSLRQRLGMYTERMHQPSLNEESLLLPDDIDIFPSRDRNRDLYLWLAAYFAHQDPATCRPKPRDPLRADLALLRRAHRTTERVLTDLPGLRDTHDRLARDLLDIRPDRTLPRHEEAIEDVVRALLSGEEPRDGLAADMWRAVTDEEPLDRFDAPSDYSPFLPVPLWGEVRLLGTTGSAPGEEPEEGGGATRSLDDKKRKGTRKKQDQAERKDSLIANNFEKILALAEMINLNRVVDDTDEDEAAKAADDLDDIVLSKHEKSAATKIRMDLDLPPGTVDTRPVSADVTYPEWDYRTETYHDDHCAVTHRPAEQEGAEWEPDDDTLRRIRRVRRQFEALRLQRETRRRQPEGDDIDIQAAVRAICDLRGSGEHTDRVYRESRKDRRDLSVAILVDVSLSTDAWVDNRRVLDVEKEALTVLSHGLDACGDEHGIFTFTSRKRTDVKIDVVKDFDEPLTLAAMRRVQALTPGYYTRLGAALRHVTAELEDRSSRDRLLLVITDGKPNDLDHYEGRYGVEDTRRAVQEARNRDVEVFGVTIDDEARDYFPYIFGRGAYQIVPDPSRLADALPKIYRRLVE